LGTRRLSLSDSDLDLRESGSFSEQSCSGYPNIKTPPVPSPINKSPPLDNTTTINTSLQIEASFKHLHKSTIISCTLQHNESHISRFGSEASLKHLHRFLQVRNNLLHSTTKQESILTPTKQRFIQALAQVSQHEGHPYSHVGPPLSRPTRHKHSSSSLTKRRALNSGEFRLSRHQKTLCQNSKKDRFYTHGLRV